jgi:hypothetical protein
MCNVVADFYFTGNNELLIDIQRDSSLIQNCLILKHHDGLITL